MARSSPQLATQVSAETASASVPPTLVVSRKTAEWLLDQIEQPGEPTPAMRALFARKERFGFAAMAIEAGELDVRTAPEPMFLPMGRIPPE